MKRFYILSIILILIISCLLSEGCLNNKKNDIIQYEEPHVKYNLQIFSNNSFTLLVPYLYIYNISDNVILSNIKSTGNNVSYSIIEITNENPIYRNLSIKDHNDSKALKIIGDGYCTISYRLNGTFEGSLSLRSNCANGSLYYIYCNKNTQHQKLSIVLVGKLIRPLSGENYGEEISIILNEKWNVKKIRWGGGIA